MIDTVACGEFGGKLAAADVRACSDDELCDAALGLQRLESLVKLTQAHVLAELEARAVTESRYGMRTPAWVAREAGAAPGPIAGELRVGRALRVRFDVVDDAVAQGALSFDHAKALVDASNPRVAGVLAGAQHELVGLAEGATFKRWKTDVAAVVEHADVDGPEPDPVESNRLRMPTGLDGLTHLDGTFDAASGLVLREAVDAKADELFRRYTRDHDTTGGELTIPSRATLRALALVELVRAGIGAEPGAGSVPRAEVTLVLHDHEMCDRDGVPVPRAAAGVWGCDPDLWAILVDTMGIPVDVGHAHRLATLAQRRAIAVRDGGCVFPGCDAPIAWCDLHHLTQWQHGGRTDLAELIALCRHHHGVTHRTGWTLTLDTNQTPTWTTPHRHPRR